MKRTNAKVTIIVPVYNVANYLAECLESLICQTLKDIEIICINDGSTDNSLEILEAYAQKDNRIIIHNKKNQGQGIARNIGIDIATGEFIGFVDPDDKIDETMYEKLYNQATILNSQIVICDYKKCIENTNKSWTPTFFVIAKTPIKAESIHIKSGVNIDKQEIKKTLLISPCYSWNRLYRTDFLKGNNITFSTRKCYEDVLFILKSHSLAENISYINQSLYFYKIRQSSTLRTYENRYLDFIDTVEEIDSYLISQNLKKIFVNNFRYFTVMGSFWIFEQLKYPSNKIKLLKRMPKYISKNDYKFLFRKIRKYILQQIFSITKKENQKILTILGKQFEFNINSVNYPIDIVYLWCDGNDENWQASKKHWQEKLQIEDINAINPCRYIDNEELRYSLRSIAQNANWINHIYIITNGQIPQWLDSNHEKISIITHNEIMPEEYLPTFNSSAIETCISNIENLSEHFLLANDDTFIFSKVTPADFFDKKSNPIVKLMTQSRDTYRRNNELYLRSIINSEELIKNKFKKTYDYEPMHNIDSYRKSYYAECKNIFNKEFMATCANKFRTFDSIQRVIVNFYMLATKNCKLKIVRTNSNKTALENIYMPLLNPFEMDRNINKHKKKLKLFCINDNENTKPEDRKSLKAYLEFLFPEKQDWEKDNY